MVKSKDRFSILAIATGFLLLLAMQPFYVWHVNDHFKLLILVAPIVPLIIKTDIQRNKAFFVVFFVILLLNVVIHGYSLFYSVYLLVFVFVPFGKPDFSAKVYDAFRKILAVVFVISLFQWGLRWLGVEMPNFYIEPLTESKKYDYVAYPPLLVVPNFF